MFQHTRTPKCQDHWSQRRAAPRIYREAACCLSSSDRLGSYFTLACSTAHACKPASHSDSADSGLGSDCILSFPLASLGGRVFVALSVAALIVHIINTGIERQLDEQMTFRLVEVGDYHTLELTTSRGDSVKAGSPELVARLRSRTNHTVRVSMTGWYDYGHLRAFRVQSIDGVSQ